MRIVLVAGEPAFRLGMHAVVEGAADMQWAGDAEDARSGFTAVDLLKPDVVVIDVVLRGMNGIDATREVKRRAPKAKVLLLSSWPRERDVLDGFAAGADGFALKTDAVDALRDAIRAVAAGQRYMTADLRGMSLQTGSSRAATKQGRDVLAVLSQREREVLGLVVKGCRSRDIARELCISIKTVETHRNHINRKLGCASAADLTRFAAENGLLRSSPGETAAPSEQTIVLFVDDDPSWRAELLRTLASQGYQCGQAATATLAMAELRGAPAPSVLVIEPRTGTAGVRAVASLPETEAGRWFAAALDRPAAEPDPAAARPISRLSS